MAVALTAFLFALSAFTAFAATGSGPGEGDVLTSIAQVRALSSEEAGRGYPVDIQALVTFQTQDSNIFVHDYKEGIYVALANKFALSPGEFIRLRGRTAAGDYAPIIRAETAQSLGRRALPQPRTVSFDELGSSNLDCEWVEVAGVVRSVSSVASNRCDLEVAVDGGRLRVYLLDPPPSSEKLVAASVRLRGARGCIFNSKRQSLGPLLFVDGSNLHVLEAAPEDPYAVPTRPVHALLQFAPSSRHGQRVKVRGVVTHHEPGELVFIRDGAQGLLMRSAAAEPLRQGDVIEALGFESVGNCGPILEDTACRKVGRASSPAPLRAALSQLMTGDFEANLVTVQGKLVDAVRRNHEVQLILENENAVFHALLRRSASELAMLPPPGSHLELTGICLAQEVSETRSTVRPESIRILMRAASDLKILQKPPWWTKERLVWALAAVTALFLAGLGAVTARARRKAREQERARAESEARIMAIMAERNRMAREIHDTLAQGFTAISVQLEVIKDKVSSIPQARKHVELARGFVRSSLAEARRSIWDMRSQALENSGLPAALGSLAHRLVEGAGIEVNLLIHGDARRLPPTVENNLLRIGQEAITNAVRHAAPKKISVELRFQPNSVILRVKDDGCGFDPSKTGASHGGFGLLGMRERAQPLSARLKIDSEFGRGTVIEVEALAG